MAADLPRRGASRARFARLPLLAFALFFACAQSDASIDSNGRLAPPDSAQAFTVVSQSPYLEVRFRGVMLRGARTEGNQLAMDFTAPIDGGMFDRLQQTLPDWVDMAYGGYDNAVIRAKQPGQFLTRNEADGFSVRFVPGPATTQTAASGAPLRGNVDQAPPSPPPPMPVDGAQSNDSPFALRGTDGLPGAIVRVSSDWRHGHHGNTYILRGSADIPVGGGFKIIGSARAALANNPAVRHLDGTITPVRTTVYNGALGLAYAFNNASDIRLEALYAASGLGGRIGANEHSSSMKLGFAGGYRVPFNFSAEEAIDHGSYDYARAFGTFRLFDGFWARGEGRFDRYAVTGDNNLATTVGFTAGLRYVNNWLGFPLGIGYDGDGDYILHKHTYLDPSLVAFTPMNIRTREAHAVSGLTHITFSDAFLLDAYGGYATDRYGTNGPFGGANIVIAPSEGWKITVNGYYSIVPYRQGQGRGPTIGAGIRLVYDLSDSVFDPFELGFMRDNI